MIRAVIFDVGGVIVRTFDHSGRRHWEQRLGLPPGGSDEVVFNSRMGQAAQRGEVTDEALWAWVGDFLKLDSALPDFRRDFWAGDAVDGDLMVFVRSLHPHYQTAIISNATDGLNRGLADYGIADAFDLIVGSAYEKIMKPDATIFERTLQRLGRRPSEAVFIDDAPVNVAGARAAGLHAIRFTPELDLRAELRRLRVTVA